MDNTREERKLLLSKIEDVCAIAEKRSCVCHSAFLDPASAAFIKKNTGAPPGMKYEFFGGYEDAERVIFAAGPDWMETLEFPVDAVYISVKGKGSSLTHRDFLGAVLALGITRDVIGDICVKDGEALLFCKSDISDYIIFNLTSIGRFSVVCSRFDLDADVFCQKKVEEVSVNVASVRLDTVISAVYRVSRSASCALIESGKVKVNHEECLKTDGKLNEGDLISVRGYGRVRFLSVGGTSKKGRLYVNVEKYV